MISRILKHSDRILHACCFDLGEQRVRTSSDFRISLRTETSRGIFLTLREENLGLIIRLELFPGSGECRLVIPPGGIIEWKSIRYRLMTLSLLPDFLQTKVGSDGYYLLPVSSGVLVDFRNRPPCKNSDRIYMDQSEWEKYSMLNCFGCLAPKQNFLVIVEEGDFFCRVDSEYNREGVNRIYPTFLIRKKPGERLRFDPCSIRLCDGGAKADYDDLAKIFRRYLLEKRGASLLRERAAGNPELQYSLDALRVKIFLAQKYPYLPDGSAPVKVHTTCDEARVIMDTMKAAGIEKATITLVGWNLGGHDGAYPSHFPIEPAIGGEKALRRLIAHAKQIGYKIVPHDNVTDIYRGSPDFDYEYVARTESQEPLCAGIWGGGQAYKACPLVQLQRYGYEFERIRELGFEGHYYLDAQSTAMWTCHSPKHPADEKEFALALASITAIPRSLFGAVAIECGSVYSIPFVDEVAAIHFGRTSPSLECLSSYPVPFFHIALHGLILYHFSGVQNPNYFPLGHLYETAFGARPCMEISYRNNGGNGGDYRKCIPRILDPYRTCFRDLKLHCVLMESLKEPRPGVYETIYENGTVLVANTTKLPFGEVPPIHLKIHDSRKKSCGRIRKAVPEKK